MKRRNFLKVLSIIPAIPILGKAVFAEPPRFRVFKGLRSIAPMQKHEWLPGNNRLLELVATNKLKRNKK